MKATRIVDAFSIHITYRACNRENFIHASDPPQCQGYD